MTNKSRLLLGLLMATPGWAYALGLATQAGGGGGSADPHAGHNH